MRVAFFLHRCMRPPPSHPHSFTFEWFSQIRAVQPLVEGKRHSALSTWQTLPRSYDCHASAALWFCMYVCECVCAGFRSSTEPTQAQCIFGTDGCVTVNTARCSCHNLGQPGVPPPTICAEHNHRSIYGGMSIFPLGLVMGLECCYLPLLYPLVLPSATPL